MLCITPCGLWQHGLGRPTALLFLPIAQAIGCKKRLVAHPDPRYHSLARVMQSILQLLKIKYTAPTRHNPAQMKSVLKG
jgi:hypothetical protein